MATRWQRTKRRLGANSERYRRYGWIAALWKARITFTGLTLNMSLHRIRIPNQTRPWRSCGGNSPPAAEPLASENAKSDKHNAKYLTRVAYLWFSLPSSLWSRQYSVCLGVEGPAVEGMPLEPDAILLQTDEHRKLPRSELQLLQPLHAGGAPRSPKTISGEDKQLSGCVRGAFKIHKDEWKLVGYQKIYFCNITVGGSVSLGVYTECLRTFLW